jgi:hypothetical protein
MAGPIIGFLVGAVGFGLSLPPDPAPGDGIGATLLWRIGRHSVLDTLCATGDENLG